MFYFSPFHIIMVPGFRRLWTLMQTHVVGVIGYMWDMFGVRGEGRAGGGRDGAAVSATEVSI